MLDGLQFWGATCLFLIVGGQLFKFEVGRRSLTKRVAPADLQTWGFLNFRINAKQPSINPFNNTYIVNNKRGPAAQGLRVALTPPPGRRSIYVVLLSSLIRHSQRLCCDCSDTKILSMHPLTKKQY